MTSPVFNPLDEEECTVCETSDGELLYDALPSCDHEIRAKELYEGGGIECVKCQGWFCY